MAIKLRVISDQYRQLGERRTRVFGVNGGSVGRAPDNDWVLPDPKRVVSGHHCDIEYRGGTYWLRDTSTNGVFVNEAEQPASTGGPVALRDGDRLRIGEYDILVSIDERVDFLPVGNEESHAEQHIEQHLGAQLDLDSLLAPRDISADSGSISVRNAFGVKLGREARGSGMIREVPDEPAPPPVAPGAADWAMKTRPISRQELNEALARRAAPESRPVPPPPPVQRQQAESWSDLRSAVQAFCRGAGIDPAALSPETQAVLPLVAGQMLREAVVGITDVLQSQRRSARPDRVGPAATLPGTSGNNPLRSAPSVEQALLRLLESHHKRFGGPIEALRDVLQEMKEHDAAVEAGARAGVEELLRRLAPDNVADQFDKGRARHLAPGQDPRSHYWDHYGELHRLLAQNVPNGLPHVYGEEFARAYDARRAELAARRRARNRGEPET